MQETFHLYTTYFKHPHKNEKSRSNSIQDPTAYLLSGGKQGTKNMTPLINTDRETRHLVKYDKKHLMLPQLRKIYEANVDEITRLTYRMNEYMDNNNVNELYYQFQIPKRSGGMRTIDAPKDELKHFQAHIAEFMQQDLKLLAHNIAHAYTKNRSAVTNATAHKDSNHFAKLDFSNFFPSFNYNLLYNTLSEVGVLALAQYKPTMNRFLDAVIRLSLKNDKLPQGTPLSPLLTNLAMIPFDYHLTQATMDWKSIIITRYADDITFSSYYRFGDSKEETKLVLENLVTRIAEDNYEGQLKLNPKKTTVGTKYGRNRITGLVVNKDNNVTVGYKEKRTIKQNLARLLINKKNGDPLEAVDEVLGWVSYMNAVEPDYTKYMLRTMQRKFKLEEDPTKYLNR